MKYAPGAATLANVARGTILILLLHVLAPTMALAAYQVINENNAVSAQRMSEVNGALATYQVVLNKYFGDDLKEDIKVIVCANKSDTAGVMVRERGNTPEQANKAVADVLGLAFEQTVVIDAEKREGNDKKTFVATIAHELFHQSQDCWSCSDFTTNQLYWFIEGTADLAGALATIEQGKWNSLEDWKSEAIANLKDESYTRPTELFYFDYPTWTASKNETINYQVSDLMVYYFVSGGGGDGNWQQYDFHNVRDFFIKGSKKENVSLPDTLTMFKTAFGFNNDKVIVSNLQAWFDHANNSTSSAGETNESASAD